MKFRLSAFVVLFFSVQVFGSPVSITCVGGQTESGTPSVVLQFNQGGNGQYVVVFNRGASDGEKATVFGGILEPSERFMKLVENTEDGPIASGQILFSDSMIRAESALLTLYAERNFQNFPFVCKHTLPLAN